MDNNYIIISRNVSLSCRERPYTFQDEVNRKLKEGYKLYGDTIITLYGDDEALYSQVLIKDEPLRDGVAGLA